jgi:HEAT repeat protein
VSDQKNPSEPKGPDFVRFDFDDEVSASDQPTPTPAAPVPPAQQEFSPEGVIQFDPTPDTALTDNILEQDDDTDETAHADDSPETALVRNLTGALVKAVKVAQLYPVENPMCRQFAEKLMARINDAFQTMDVIRLSVGKTKLFFGGESVIEQSGGDDSVPGRLFWAGVREISFHIGLTSQEALDFLATFRSSDQQLTAGEGDIVTLLWEGRFEHITYIAIDDILDLENEEDPVPKEFGMDFMNFVDLEMHDLDNEEENEHKANEMAEEIRKKMGKEDVALFGISEEELAAIRAEIEEEESPRMLTDIVQILGETLYHETDEVSFLDLVQVLAGALLALIGEGRLAESTEVIHMMVNLRTEGTHFTPAQLTVLDAGLASSYDEMRRESLVRHLDSGRRSSLDALNGFVRSLPEGSIEAMCDLLGNLQTPPARRRMVEALSHKAQQNVRPFLPFLQDSRTDLVRSVAGILAGAKSDQAIPALTGLLKHPDFQVRRDALSALSKLGSGRAMDMLADSLFDRDPRIRMAGARYLGMSGRQSIPILITVIESEDFDQRPLPEKRSFYEALGYAGGTDMLPLMERALKRKSWLFGKTEATEIRACACEALGWIGGPEARELLNLGMHDRSVLVRTAAQSGLRRIAAGKKEPLLKEAA